MADPLNECKAILRQLGPKRSPPRVRLRRDLEDGAAPCPPGDQARVVTPADAIAAGASHIVVGRPVIEAADPGKAATEILEEMEATVSQIR